MSVYTACLRKEWRELRSWFVALAVTIPLLQCAYAFGYPDHWKKLGNVPLLCGLLSMLMAGLSLGGRLVGAEIAGSGQRFLDRLPRGLSWPFLAKATLLTAAVFSCTIYGHAVAATLRQVAFGHAHDWSSLLWRKQWVPVLLFVGPAFGLMALSAWMPRSGMTLPGLLLLYVVTLGPPWLCFDLLPGLRPSAREILTAWTLVSAGSVAAAAVSFVRGYRRTGGPGRALLQGGLVMLLFTLPVWGWTGYRVFGWVCCDPTSEHVLIMNGFLGADRRHAYLTVYQVDGPEARMEGPLHTVRVDLETGAWKRDAGAGSHYQSIGLLDRSSDAECQLGFPRLILRIPDGGTMREVIDTRSGQVVHRVARHGPRSLIAEDIRSVKRASTPWRLADGRRAWFNSGVFEAENAEGQVEVILRTAGLGCVTWSPVRDMPAIRMPDQKTYLCDLDRGRVTDWEIWNGPVAHASLESGYLIRNRKVEAFADSWHMQDPETRGLSPALGLEPGDQVVAQNDARRVWVVSRAHGAAAGDVYLVDPRTGLREAVPLQGMPSGCVESIRNPGIGLAPVRTPDERRVFLVVTSEGLLLARFDATSATLVPSGVLPRHHPWRCHQARLLACPDDGSAILINEDKTILRAHFGSPRIETLFPRP